MPRYIVKNAKELGSMIAAVRQERGLSRQDVADHVNATRQYVRDVETNTRLLYATRLFRILATLGIRVTLEYEPDPPDEASS